MSSLTSLSNLARINTPITTKTRRKKETEGIDYITKSFAFVANEYYDKANINTGVLDKNISLSSECILCCSLISEKSYFNEFCLMLKQYCH